MYFDSGQNPEAAKTEQTLFLKKLRRIVLENEGQIENQKQRSGTGFSLVNCMYEFVMTAVFGAGGGGGGV